MSPEERNAIRGLSREDLGEVVRALPAAVVLLLGLVAFCILLFTLAPAPQ